MSNINIAMRSKNQFKVSLTRLDSSLFMQKAIYDTDRDGLISGNIIALDSTNFNGNLSSTDNTVQKALQSIDEMIVLGGGETNTASNIGAAGVGVFKQKSGVDLQFKKINAGSSKVTITDDVTNNEIDIDVAISKTDVGLSNVDNTSDLNKPISTAVQTALDSKSSTSHSHSGVYEPANANIQSHISSTSNPHSVTKAQVGLTNVSDVPWGKVNAQTDTYTLQSADNGKVLTINKSTSVTITIPDTLSSEFSCTVIQIGTGQVTFSVSGSMAIRNRSSHTKIAGQYGVASLYVYAANNILLGGDTAS